MLKRNGLSLIEIIIYLFLSAIFLNIGIMSFDMLERQKIIYTAQELKNKLAYCQKNAIDENRKYEIRIQEDKNYYEIRCEGGKTHNNRIISTIKEIYLPAGIKARNSIQSGEITYTSSGTIQKGTTITILGEKYFLEMTVNVSSGRIAKIAEIKQLRKK